ncbi:MAG: PhzF family phenazine biosynthesis protein [Nitrospirae bacterium]|nr:PhzF family phenazine biosynthesis protein [Nitrospirota bacterium]MBF0541673.1 PhzF family phenazine biosynthesis protein [Nitrospirota bacterium]
MNNKIYIVDVFAEQQFSGNQLAVVINDNNLTTEQMQAIARETNYSETTFLNTLMPCRVWERSIQCDPKQSNGYNVRIFTPSLEIPFAGHPVLGSAYIIAQYLHPNVELNSILINLKSGLIPVSIHRKNHIIQRLVMNQPEPKFAQIFTPEIIAPVLNIETELIDQRFPIMEVSNGFSVIIVPINTLDALINIKINRQKYDRLIENITPKAILVFCKGSISERDDLSVRFFADFYGIPEDPATGSANGSLAGYIVKTNYFGSDKIDITVEQGYNLGRPSRLYLTAKESNSKIEVMVGGRVFGIMEGRLL